MRNELEQVKRENMKHEEVIHNLKYNINILQSEKTGITDMQ